MVVRAWNVGLSEDVSSGTLYPGESFPGESFPG